MNWPTPKPSRSGLAGVFQVVVRRRISGDWERLGPVRERRVLTRLQSETHLTTTLILIKTFLSKIQVSAASMGHGQEEFQKIAFGLVRISK